jgi:hypothetical protein
MNNYNRVLFTDKDNESEIKRALETFFNFITSDILDYFKTLLMFSIRSEFLENLNNMVREKYVQRDEILQEFLEKQDMNVIHNNIIKTLNEKINTNVILKNNMDLLYKIIGINNDSKKLKSLNKVITDYYKDDINTRHMDSTRLIFNNNIETMILSEIKNYSVDSIIIQKDIMNKIKTMLEKKNNNIKNITKSEELISIYTNIDEQDLMNYIKESVNKHSKLIEKFSNNNILFYFLIILFVVILLVIISIMVSNKITMKCVADECTTRENISRILLSLSALFFFIFLVKKIKN